MTSHVKADLQELARLATQLNHSAHEMRSAMRLLKELGPKGAGSAELESACDDFQDAWGDGIDLIAKATIGVTEGLVQVRGLYGANDHQVREQFRSIAPGVK